ncbi:MULTISPECIES: cytochrome c oxidase subunit 3 [Sphingobacterium]|jgi:cytochrome c oxidase subunit 3|uniref:Cytochrome c oxidase subunit 3 n=1 Tax=Sphingobacterium paramultivorum TaxID=2886510 RepID=A0A7G5E5I4_9SPHI|nr:MULTISPECIES: cytochrome c oxidase subunit 3 [Sphingobacterium]MCS4166818.1 cytochrome c oxidase subunit 3 [Sphingobacterium sp. BIGb0116]OFV17709.1 cytochrome C oxidase subunit III [Sphingobacterium sp. HMSC13C05]QMV69259.1 cytochrome c oxidase subunit 3 [Sphingobacterium paramultivorum]WET70273.1 MAG: cytochrome c oxidase subunit 3 [Sphingobacterium sp.]WSO13053.1 cytochrome c oxidase subunit 3 [Sphingobacterium paramultivorum]
MLDIQAQTDEKLVQRKAQKFNLWLGMLGMFMMFAALSSGFIVYTASGVDKGIKTLLPNALLYSTLVIVVSSLTMFLAHRAAKNGESSKQRLFLIATFILGVVFFALQVHAWNVLIDRGVYFVNNNASQSFIYVFIWMHLAHIIAGLIVLIGAIIGINKLPKDGNLFRMDLASIFWHFLDLLWIYIYVFLLLNQ